jgi:hypothetical protein
MQVRKPELVTTMQRHTKVFSLPLILCLFIIIIITHSFAMLSTDNLCRDA